jgi:hypothetical protein
MRLVRVQSAEVQLNGETLQVYIKSQVDSVKSCERVTIFRGLVLV